MKQAQLFALCLMAGTAAAQAQSQSTDSGQTSMQHESVIEAPLPMEPPVVPEDIWATKHEGVIGQFLNAPSVWEPINLFAKPEVGFGEANLNKDPITGQVMGLNLLALNF